MFDNLRDDASPSYFEEEVTVPPEEYVASLSETPKRKSSGKFLGMTARQRLIIALMMLIAVCTLGTMCLLFTGRIGLF
jgi:hypothetical protein